MMTRKTDSDEIAACLLFREGVVIENPMVCFGCGASAAYLAHAARSREGLSAGDRVGFMLVY